jgi:hypothetical protein
MRPENRFLRNPAWHSDKGSGSMSGQGDRGSGCTRQHALRAADRRESAGLFQEPLPRAGLAHGHNRTVRPAIYFP